MTDTNLWSKDRIAIGLINLIAFNLITALLLFFVKNNPFFSFMFGSMIYTYQAWFLYLGASLFAIALSLILQKINELKKRRWVLCAFLFLTTLLFGFFWQQVLLMYFGFFVQTSFLENGLLSFTLNKSIGFFTIPVWLILALIQFFIFKQIKAKT